MPIQRSFLQEFDSKQFSEFSLSLKKIQKILFKIRNQQIQQDKQANSTVQNTKFLKISLTQKQIT
ncbi:hypothetical protein TTHERM_00330030 (macronuclear) [Tetrahymena thermophila SB210]|uniref:Uncharacterized protein n=1 Tax=Tetrahymena thermophila (strain SB210) TaxID=312017 RepID=I7LXW5_TETTS|nr:hypothetical protein TTHERM_00330030 [Tetrahymena thermophila SB210]EAS06323.1 hypothetical protein TTHERM_00330030 [Tetrahymena thermophila SB210]|eukprot:XP_001026568.1 hypothetical protein TTHERM_00330030 [Tetrahymena thermophila SB210]